MTSECTCHPSARSPEELWPHRSPVDPTQYRVEDRLLYTELLVDERVVVVVMRKYSTEMVRYLREQGVAAAWLAPGATVPGMMR